MHVKITDCYNGVEINKKNMAISNLKIVRGSEHGVPPNLGTAIRLDLNDYEVSDCYIENVKYGVWIADNSSCLRRMTIRNVKEGIRLYNPYMSNAAEFHNIEIDSCYLFGFLMSVNYCKAYINECQFNRVYWYGLWNPFDNGSCEVEYTTFESCGDSAIYVYSKGPNIDLGTDGCSECSEGWNRFLFSQSSFSPLDGYLIYNASDDTTHADNCCWGNSSSDCLWTGWQAWVYYYSDVFPSTVTIKNWNDPHQRKCPCTDYTSKALADNTKNKPVEYSLSQNHPNPFNPITDISYAIPKAGHVSIVIYNVLGQEVVKLVDSYHEIGEYTVSWLSKDQLGNQVASGVYYYQLISEDFVSSKKMLVLK
jgi:hypothetical protein